jgi:nicotinate-nucleotide pyrophosphorylase (carboxylating)
MIEDIIRQALIEDIGDGDHSSLACIPENATGTAKLLVKDEGVLAGVELAEMICGIVDPELEFEQILSDGDRVKFGDIAFYLKGSAQSILKAERLVLNFMQRMSGIATTTASYVDLIKDTRTRLLDTRKTTPGIRYMEKWAVRIGGGHNHRFALFAGGIEQAILKTEAYLKNTGKDLKVEIEVRNINELEQVLAIGKVDRIMLDNFTPELLKIALEKINGRFETEASGGITKDTIQSFAASGVDFISVGALTHSFKSLDLSLKATFNH